MKQYRFAPMGKNFVYSVAQLIVAATLVFSFAACDTGGGSDKASEEDGGIPTPTPTPGGTPVSTSPLTVRVETQWENDPTGPWQLAKLCEVDAAAAYGSTDTCQVSIEEGRLFYSKVRFTVATSDTIRCRVLKFQPYYYLREDNDPVFPVGVGETVDCDATDGTPTLDPKCYGGAAAIMVPDFMTKNIGLYFVTALGSSYSATADSEATKRMYMGAKHNRLICNDKSNKTAAVAGYIASTMQDYEFICEDEWGYPYHKITMVIEDEDKDGFEGHAEDNYIDWP